MAEHRSRRRPDIVAIGGSAGGIEAACELLKNLPGDLRASLLVVLHRPVEKTSALRSVLARHTNLTVKLPREGEFPEHGVCYVGDPGQHLMLDPDGRIHFLADGFYRAHSIDALFQSLARNAPNRTVGVIVSGMRKDGSLGLKAIKEAGGVALVQNPKEALYPEMPQSAIDYCKNPDLVADARGLAARIRQITNDEDAEAQGRR